MEHTGLTITTERGTVQVPQSVEAEGGAAIEAYVAAELAKRPAPQEQSANA